MTRSKVYKAKAVHFDGSERFLSNQGSGGVFDPELGKLLDAIKWIVIYDYWWSSNCESEMG